MKNNMYSVKTYFAAANGFDGFKSNFDSVFSPHKLNKLFILKGGPGTGKSTLLKAIAEHFTDKAAITKILCSSDTASLDGVILERAGKTVGIADGTHPHAIEPSFPGAIEEIVNLGDGFDYTSLMAASEEIKALSENKSISYKTAYHALKISGEIYNYIDMFFSNNGTYKEAETLARGLIKGEGIGEDDTPKHAFLLSSFSKDGYKCLPIPMTEKEVIRIKGDGITEYAVMREIVRSLKDIDSLKAIYTSPLCSEMIDAIESDLRVYTVIEENQKAVDTLSIIKNNDEYERLHAAYKFFLSEAQSSFKDASESHFALEDIYSKNISFDNNEATRMRIIKNIDAIFNK